MTILNSYEPLPNDQLEVQYRNLVTAFPLDVQNLIPIHVDERTRYFRQNLGTVFLGEPTPQQAKLLQYSELLALTTILNSPTFKPTTQTPSDVARLKATAYASQYVTIRANELLGQSQLPEPVKQAIMMRGHQYALANLTRLSLNFNLREQLSSYLKDLKNRYGQLAAITCMVATASAGAGDVMAVSELTAQIGMAVGTAVAITMETTSLTDPQQFTDQILRGEYPATLIFAAENHPKSVNAFFHQSERPSPEQFKSLRALSLSATDQALQLSIELINQAIIDCHLLPAGAARTRLETLTNSLRPQKSQSSINWI